MSVKQIGDGRTTSRKSNKSNQHLLRRVQTLLFTLSAVMIVCLFAIPLFLDQVITVNSGSAEILENNPDAPLPTPTPIPEALISVSSSHASAAAPTPVSTAQVHVSQYTLLKQNDNYPSVMNLQLRLMELGYLDSDEPTTHYGRATAAAVSLYQRTLDYEMNGVADSALQEHLFSNDAEPYEIKLGDTGSDVESMQSRLSELGYYTEKESGFFGVATETAVKAFQKKNSIDVDGVFHYDDRELLFSPDARPAVDPTPTPSPTPKATKKPTKTPKPSASSSSGSSSEKATPKPTEKPSSEENDSFNASYSADGLVSVAKAKLGKPYVWSEEGPNSFDCSGLVYYCLRTCGVKVSRYNAKSFSQYDSWKNISDRDDLKKGDLVFFKSDSSSSVNHTGIYIGSNRFIHASSSAGEVITSNITTSYWTRNFVNGRRVF